MVPHTSISAGQKLCAEIVAAVAKFGDGGKDGKADGEGGIGGFVTLLCQENRKAATMVLARALPLLMLGTLPEPADYKSEAEIRARLAELGINFDDVVKLPPFSPDVDGSKDPSLEPDAEREPAAQSDAKAADATGRSKKSK